MALLVQGHMCAVVKWDTLFHDQLKNGGKMVVKAGIL